MPNWCTNYIRAVGPTEDVARMAEQINEANSFLQGLYPVRTLVFDWFNGFRIVDAEWDYSKWVELYGTKWTDDSPIVTVVLDAPEGTGVLSVMTVTAWAPPLEGIIAISSAWESVTLGTSWSEAGMGIFGFSVVKNGNVIVDTDIPEPDFGNWEEDPDSCVENQFDFETSLAATVDQLVDAYHR